jgi:hypothetical protein
MATTKSVSKEAAELQQIMGQHCGESILFSKTNCIYSQRAREALDKKRIRYVDVRLDADQKQPLGVLAGCFGKPSTLTGAEVQVALHQMLVHQDIESSAIKATVPQFFKVNCAAGKSPAEFEYIGDSTAIVAWANQRP